MATQATSSRLSSSDGTYVPEQTMASLDENTHTEAPPTEKGENRGPPDGGLQAWLVAAGGASIFFSCLGFANSVGALQEYYLNHQLKGESEDKVAWIGSLAAFLQFGAGVVGGPLFDRYGGWVIKPAAIAYIFAMMMLSLCKTYWQIMLVQGVLLGTISGFLQVPAFAAAAQWFDKKSGMAFGLVVSGSSVGGVVVPIMLSKMLNGSSLSFGWSIRIVGFVLMPFLIFSSLTVKARVPSRKTAFWLAAPFKNTLFVCCIIALFFMFFGMLTPVYYLPTYASAYRGMDATLAGYLLAIFNGASTFGRIIPGILSDKYGKLNVFAMGGIGTGITVFCMNSVESHAALIVYAVAVGFISGTIVSGASAVVSICVDDARETGTYFGMGMPFGALGALIGPPVNGKFLSHYGGFFELCMFSGTLSVVGGLVALASKMLTPKGILGRT